jgi:hypothetical protein
MVAPLLTFYCCKRRQVVDQGQEVVLNYLNLMMRASYDYYLKEEDLPLYALMADLLRVDDYLYVMLA